MLLMFVEENEDTMTLRQRHEVGAGSGVLFIWLEKGCDTHKKEWPLT